MGFVGPQRRPHGTPPTLGSIARAFYRMSTRLGEKQAAVAAGLRRTPPGLWPRSGRLWHSTSRALIVVLAGPTRSLRWELDTILIDADSWSKLLILMPPSTQQDKIAARNELVEALHDRSWRDALFGLEPHEIVAMQLMEHAGPGGNYKPPAAHD